MRTETFVLNEARSVTLTSYLQPVGGEFGALTKRPAVLIIPGGGYHFCSDREAEPVAYAYLKAGYHAFILRYSLNEKAEWPNPLCDYEQAMGMIRANAKSWHVASDRIAVIGFSAGGHLAACAATMSKERPNAAILGYPVIDGDCAGDYLPSAPDVIAAVDEFTCPCFVFATRTDNLVPVGNSIHLIDALCRHDVAFESHIYSNGPHGLTTGDDSLGVQDCCSRYPHWVDDSITWLKDMLGGFDSNGLTAPRFGAIINGNHEEKLNLNCTVAYLRSQSAAAELLSHLIPEKQEGMSLPKSAEKVISLGQILAWGGADENTIRAIEAQLMSMQKEVN